MSIRSKLILTFLVLATAPMITMEVLGFFSARESLEEAHIAGLESTADLKAAQIESFLNGLRADMRIAQDYFNIRTNLPIVSRFVDDRANAVGQRGGGRIDLESHREADPVLGGRGGNSWNRQPIPFCRHPSKG
jgi:hypothetical protein